MSYPVALFFADAHVDTHAWVDHPTLRGDSMHAFRHLVDRAIHYKVACVFAAGDLIDVRRPSSEVAEFIRTQMERLECAQIEFHYIQGQHELSSPPWMAALHDWPKHLSEDAVVVDGDHEIYGLDWQPADQLAGKLAEVPESSDVLMAHQVWEDFMGDKAAFEGSFEQVPTETMFTGDFHKLRDMEVTGSKMQKLRVISPGATNMRAMGESSRKYYMLLHDDGSWHRKRIPTRPYGEIDLDNEQMLDAFEKDWPGMLANMKKSAGQRQLPEGMYKPMFRVIHPDNLSLKKTVQKVIGKDAFIFYKRVRVETEEKQQRRIERRLVLDRGVNGCLPLAVPSTDKRFKPLARLLNSDNPKAELLAMKKEVFGDDGDNGS